MKKIGVFLAVVCMGLGFTGCSKTKEFDAKGYLKSYLDAAYKNDYKAFEIYAEFVGEKPEDIRDKWDEQTYEEVTSYLMKKYPKEKINSVTNFMQYLTEAKKLARYEVLKAVKTEDGFQVNIKVEPSNVLETWKEHSNIEEVKKLSENYSDTGDALAELLRIAIKENKYDDAKEIEVQIMKDGEDIYIEANQKDMLEHALFPKRALRTVIQAMFTCPNEDLFSQNAIVIIGEGVEGKQDVQKVKEEQERIADNWEKKVGDAFAPGALDKFLGESASFYLAEAQLEGKEISVKEIKGEEETDTTETYAVTILNGGTEETLKLKFTYNEKDLIKSVSFE